MVATGGGALPARAAEHECPSRRPRAYIRVDQVGYQANAPKRAYVLSTKPQAGVCFTRARTRARTVVFSGTVGPALGRWSGRARARCTRSTSTPSPRPGRTRSSSPARRRPALRRSPSRPRQQLYEAPLGQRAQLLRERARRPRIHPLGAALGARPPQRRARDDLRDPEGERRRGVQGRTPEPRRNGSTPPVGGGTPATT